MRFRTLHILPLPSFLLPCNSSLLSSPSLQPFHYIVCLVDRTRCFDR